MDPRRFASGYSESTATSCVAVGDVFDAPNFRTAAVTATVASAAVNYSES